MRRLTRYIIIPVLLSCTTLLSGQDVSFDVIVSSDTLLHGNILKVKFEVKNTQGQFEPPSFEDWQIVGGPNTSSQFSMINGKVSQSSSYEYVLLPTQEGSLVIDAATLNDGEQKLTTDPILVTILPNPEGVNIVPQGYGYRQKIHVQSTPQDTLSPQDSLRIKLSRLKSTKI